MGNPPGVFAFHLKSSINREISSSIADLLAAMVEAISQFPEMIVFLTVDTELKFLSRL